MNMIRDQYYPGGTGILCLDPSKEKLTPYLRQQGWLEMDDSIKSLEKPGDGNMNFVLRVIPSKAASFIIKQARPWVEKYPELEAPVNRIHVEHRYYQELNKYPKFSLYSPSVLGFDPVNNVMALEDLGPAADLTFVYQKDSQFQSSHLSSAMDYLNNLRRVHVTDYPSNLALRKLNHQHIFFLPFTENSFNLNQIQPGLQQLANQCKLDQQLTSQVELLGKCYLGSGTCLLHGDFYPGSMLESGKNLKIIDPEFSFVGPEEWDIAVFTAHLFLAQTTPGVVLSTLKRYQPASGFDHKKFAGFTGTEILRRLIGLAQVPVAMSLNQKHELIQEAISWIKTGKIGVKWG